MKLRTTLLSILFVAMGFCALASAANVSLDDIFDKQKVAESAVDSWAILDDKGGYLWLGLALLCAMASILIGVFAGVGRMNISKLSGNNDEHAKGQSGLTVAVLSAVLMVVSLTLVSMVYATW